MWILYAVYMLYTQTV